MADPRRSPDCTVNRPDCHGPGTYDCDDLLWGSPCRAWQARNGGYSRGPAGREVASPTDAEALARRFHETYEELADAFGYRTREASAVPWARVPVRNRLLMIATCERVLALTVIGTVSAADTPPPDVVPPGYYRDDDGELRPIPEHP